MGSPPRIFLTILGNEFMIMINQNILILRPKFNVFWAIFIRIFLTFNTSEIIVTIDVNRARLKLTFTKHLYYLFITQIGLLYSNISWSNKVQIYLRTGCIFTISDYELYTN